MTDDSFFAILGSFIGLLSFITTVDTKFRFLVLCNFIFTVYFKARRTRRCPDKTMYSALITPLQLVINCISTEIVATVQAIFLHTTLNLFYLYFFVIFRSQNWQETT